MIDWHDVIEGTAIAAGLGVLVQAVEDRAPTTQKADLYTGLIAGAGYVGGLVLVNANSEAGRGEGAYEAGEALLYGASALLAAEGTRYVDHRLAAGAAASAANQADQLNPPPSPQQPLIPGYPDISGAPYGESYVADVAA
jgi:hypothetical protein